MLNTQAERALKPYLIPGLQNVVEKEETENHAKQIHCFF